MRVGVLGCGLVAQVMHIPYLAELPGPELHAFVDPARERAETLADRYDVPYTFGDHQALLEAAGDDLDAVVVLTPSHAHADPTVDALEEGLAVLVEKPIATTPEDARRMIEAATDADVPAMVAYMKRYDPAYEAAKARLEDFDRVDVVTAYDVDPDHDRIVNEVYDLVAGDPPADFLDESAVARRATLEDALSAESPDETLLDAYDFQLEHVCHDVNVLRGLFGDVVRINHARMLAEGRYLTAHLTYEDGVECILESGDSDRKWFEEFVRVDTPEGMVRLEFSNPFIKNTPSELRVKTGREELTDTTSTPSYEEPFKRELRHFYRCFQGEETVRTPFSEARDDVQLIGDLVDACRRETPIER